MQTFDSVCCDLVKNSNIVTVFSTYINIICTRQQTGVILSLATLGTLCLSLSSLSLPSWACFFFFPPPSHHFSPPGFYPLGGNQRSMKPTGLQLSKVPELEPFGHSQQEQMKAKRPDLLVWTSNGGQEAWIFRPVTLYTPRDQEQDLGLSKWVFCAGRGRWEGPSLGCLWLRIWHRSGGDHHV